MFLYLRQKVLAIREKFTFFNEHQMPIFRARGSFFSMPKRYELLCANTNQPLAKIRRKFWAIMPTFYIYDLTTNQQICRIKKRFRIGRPKLDIKTPAGRYTITGSLFAYSFAIHTPDGQQFIQVRKRIISWGDTYEIHLDQNFKQPHIAAAIVLTIDCALHSQNRQGDFH